MSLISGSHLKSEKQMMLTATMTDQHILALVPIALNE